MVLTANGSGSGNWDKGSDSVKFEISFTAASFAAQRNPTPFAKTSPHHRWTRLKHAAIAPGTSPISGRKHQLRVHMAALGAPFANDGMYPSVRQREPGDYSAPLQLLANRLSFVDPLSGIGRSFSSNFVLRD
jgi:hypothetical protein